MIIQFVSSPDSIFLVVRQKLKIAVTRKDEISQLLILTAEEAAKAKLKALV